MRLSITARNGQETVHHRRGPPVERQVIVGQAILFLINIPSSKSRRVNSIDTCNIRVGIGGLFNMRNVLGDNSEIIGGYRVVEVEHESQMGISKESSAPVTRDEGKWFVLEFLD